MSDGLHKVPYEKIEAVFFDVGGTLLSIDYEKITKALNRHNLNLTIDDLARADACAKPIVSEAILKSGQKAEDLFALYIHRMLNQLTLPHDINKAHIIKDIRDQIVPPFGASSELWNRPLPHAKETLTKLQEMGLKLAVVSNSDGSVEQGLEQTELRHFFEIVTDSHVVGYDKPDPRIFLPALEHTGITADRTLYVGDIYAGDIIGCRAAGLHGVLLNPYEDYKDIDCDTIAHLLEIPERIAAAC